MNELKLNYQETDESRELFYYIYSTGKIYARTTTPIILNLAKKYEKGVFETEKALKAFYNLACEGAKEYAKEFAHIEEFNKIFSVSDRKTAACQLLEYYWENINGENPLIVKKN